MPDDWEKANGLNPNDASDASLYTIDATTNGGHGWYTNIEVYCNSLVEDIVKKENADAITAVDEYYPKVNATSTAISNVRTTDRKNTDTAFYNFKGQRVGSSYRGVVVTDGRVKIR